MTYRRDIDGLRALAVLAVIFYHFGFLRCTGGYVGVDIFFVISGYLIGGIIIDETLQGSFGYVQFYVRRIKRLLPASLLVALLTLPPALWLLMPLDLWSHGKSLVAGVLYRPNVRFYRDVGYFGAAAATKPMLHTWSLGVEEQFYIFFPLLMRLAVRRGPQAMALSLASVGALSFAGSQYLLSVDPAASFYWLPPRAWELLLGAAVALPALKQARVGPRWGAAWTALSVSGLLLPIALYNDTTPFPGLAAVPPCLATAWLLWWGGQHRDGRVQRVLASAGPAFAGQISYSLYLWHWPVHVFVGYYFAGGVPSAANAAALVAVAGLSVLSWRFVEQPFRRGQWPASRVFGAALAGSVLVGGLGLWLHRTGGLPGRLTAEQGAIATAAHDFMQTGGSCVSEDNPRWPGLSHCEIGVPDTEPNFLIWGDSHVRAIRDGAHQLAVEHRLNGRIIWYGGCMPAFDIVKVESATGPRGDRACAEQNVAVKALLSRPSSIKNILLVGRWAYYTEGQGTGVDSHNRIEVRKAGESGMGHQDQDQAEVVANALRNTVAWLRSQGYEVYLLEQVPEIAGFSGRRLFQVVRSAQDNLEGAVARFGTVSTAEVDGRQRRANAALLRAARDSGARVIPTHQLFCDGEVCSAMFGDTPAYFDNNHLTVATSVRMRQILLPAFAR
jgi:peptidoglycan/LPS O-acetylase OafA/YrhL